MFDRQEGAGVTADAILEQAQVFASAWSLVGGRFDFGYQIEEMEREKAELRRLVERLASERDALAAQVEKIGRLFDELRSRYVSNFRTKHEFVGYTGLHENWRAIDALLHDESHETSLGRLKAQWQAEAWIDAADEVMKLTYPMAAKTFRLTVARHLKYKAEILRQGADEIAAGGES